MPRCSIVIPAYNRASLTRQCLDTLLAHPPEAVDCEIIVVDDASTDVTQSVLATYEDRIRVVTHTTNRGFSVACNDGAAVAGGEYLIFLNFDTIPQPGWLDALVAYADAHPAAAIAGSKLLYPNDTIQHAGVVICQDRFPRHLYAGFPADHPAVCKSRRFQIVTAACALVRRRPFDEARGFDTSFVNGYEDVDLCLRLGELGYEIHFCHESILYHLESVSDRRFEHNEHNTQLYLSRWAPRVQPDDLQYYLEDGLLKVSYPGLYPVQFTVSPLVGTIERDEREAQIERLLSLRARQVFDLLRQNIALMTQTAGVAAHPVRHHMVEAPRGNRSPSDEVEPQVLFQGTIHTLSSQAHDRLISVVLPTKNGARQLRELLPRVLSQQIDGQLEIVAVDSGSHDDTVDVLHQFGATVVSINPRSFNHGATRTLATQYARGHVLVFVSQNALPADERWLANLVMPLNTDSRLAGVCSRVLPHSTADVLTKKDGVRDPSASPDRVVRQITNWNEYRSFTHHQLRLYINFHTVSAAVRSDVVAQIPFRRVTTIGEDVLWAKEVLEAGYKLQHEPSSVVFHSHEYSYFEILQRNVDDGIANREIVGRELRDDEVLPTILALVHDDWQYLERQSDLDASALEHWRIASVLRRTAQIVGQWIGVNRDRVTGDLMSLVSLTERIKAGTVPEVANAQVS